MSNVKPHRQQYLEFSFYAALDVAKDKAYFMFVTKTAKYLFSFYWGILLNLMTEYVAEQINHFSFNIEVSA